MELEELRSLWEELSDQLDKQKKLTDEIIKDMTQQKYKNKFQRLRTYETFGAIVCFLMAIYIMLNFGKLDAWYLQVCGGLTLFFLILMPVLVLRSIRQIQQIRIEEYNYKETIVAFERAKRNLLMLQQFSVYLSLGLFFVSIPVASKLLSGKDFFLIERSFWFYPFVALVFGFLLYFIRWGYRCYKNITSSAELILKELDT